jgi:hypothetical protein
VSRVAERVEKFLQRETPAWGIRPVPPERRQLGGLDLGVLWFDLSIGLLVMVTGALLVPALGFGSALLAIAVGTVVGCVPLALVAGGGGGGGGGRGGGGWYRSGLGRAPPTPRACRRWCCSGRSWARAVRRCRRC